MSWIKIWIVGLIIGLILGMGAYLTLCRVGADMMLESTGVETVAPLKYQDLRLSKGFVFDTCALTPVRACEVLESLSFDKETASTLQAVQASENGLQPYGMGAEDDVTAAQIAQPTDPKRPMVTWHGMFIQGSL